MDAMAKGRPIAFDITHLLSRLHISTPTGIDRVDFNYARQLIASGQGSAVWFWLGYPTTLPPKTVESLVDFPGYAGDDIEKDAIYSSLLDWLQRDATWIPRHEITRLSKSASRTAAYIKGAQRYLRAAVSYGVPSKIPPGAVYLSVTQWGAREFATVRWLKRRPDIKPVFFVHDLLPLDHPEYFPVGYGTHFDRFIDTITRLAAGFIVASEVIAERLRKEIRRRGRPPTPIHVAPLPPSVLFLTQPDESPVLQRIPYFVVCGTLEPRKNHLMLLNIWREFASQTTEGPRLIIIGERGWENEQIVDMLERCEAIRRHIVEVSGLSDVALRQILSNACGLLFPSFSEGYGLPMVEALSLGIPVIASDIAVCREVTQGCAIYRHPLDGPGWAASITALSRRHSPTWVEAQLRASQFQAPSWKQHFRTVSQFLESV